MGATQARRVGAAAPYRSACCLTRGMATSHLCLSCAVVIVFSASLSVLRCPWACSFLLVGRRRIGAHAHARTSSFVPAPILSGIVHLSNLQKKRSETSVATAMTLNICTGEVIQQITNGKSPRARCGASSENKSHECYNAVLGSPSRSALVSGKPARQGTSGPRATHSAAAAATLHLSNVPIEDNTAGES